MIITRTPFRITLGGGGTDLPSYYSKHGGFIFGMGLDKYMYVMVGAPIVDEKIRLHYSRSETVDHVSELQHELAREALRYRGIERQIEISSMADLPAGTGLGSSSAYLVGLLAALQQRGGGTVTPSALAAEACHIELEVLGKGIGKQDQYMAAFGGLTVLEIDRAGTVSVRRVELPAASVDSFVANTHLYYTGVRRSAEEVLRPQNLALSGGGEGGGGGARQAGARTGAGAGEGGAQSGRAERRGVGGSEGGAAETGSAPGVVEESLHQIKDLGYRILDTLEAGELDDWGLLLHEHWTQKKKMSAKISLSAVDLLYEEVRAEYGVLGGKIAGAGGGGFLMLYAPGRHEELERFMAARGMPRLRYEVAYAGTEVIVDLTAGGGKRTAAGLGTGSSAPGSTDSAVAAPGAVAARTPPAGR